MGAFQHLSLVEYTDAARPFVFSTFADSMADTPGICAENRRLYEFSLKRLLREPGTRTALVTPHGSPDEFMGWAVASPTSLVYVYVRHHYRRGKILQTHVGTWLIEVVTGSRETPVAIWTTDASRMAASGFPLRYDLDENEKFRQLAR